jgi:hypothetical protein
MTDDKKPGEDGPDREPVYYYSRERRLSRASQAVRDINEDTPSRAGFAKSLFGNRGNTMVFASIFAICAMFFIVSRLASGERGAKLGGNSLTLSVTGDEELRILMISKSMPKKGEAYTGAVDIAVSPVMQKINEGEIPPAFYHRVFFNPVVSENYQIALPFEENAFLVILRTEGEQKSLRVNAGKKK